MIEEAHRKRKAYDIGADRIMIIKPVGGRLGIERQHLEDLLAVRRVLRRAGELRSRHRKGPTADGMGLMWPVRLRIEAGRQLAAEDRH